MKGGIFSEGLTTVKTFPLLSESVDDIPTRPWIARSSNESLMLCMPLTKEAISQSNLEKKICDHYAKRAMKVGFIVIAALYEDMKTMGWTLVVPDQSLEYSKPLKKLTNSSFHDLLNMMNNMKEGLRNNPAYAKIYSDVEKEKVTKTITAPHTEMMFDYSYRLLNPATYERHIIITA